MHNPQHSNSVGILDNHVEDAVIPDSVPQKPGFYTLLVVTGKKNLTQKCLVIQAYLDYTQRH